MASAGCDAVAAAFRQARGGGRPQQSSKRNISDISSSETPRVAKRQKSESPAESSKTEMAVDHANASVAPSSISILDAMNLPRSISAYPTVEYEVGSPQDYATAASDLSTRKDSGSTLSDHLRASDVATLATSTTASTEPEILFTYANLTCKPSPRATEYFNRFSNTLVNSPSSRRNYETILQKILSYALQRVDDAGNVITEDIRPHYKFGILRSGLFGEGIQDEIQCNPNIDLSVLRVNKLFHDCGVTTFYGCAYFYFSDPERCYWWLRQIKDNIDKVRHLRLELCSGYWSWSAYHSDWRKTDVKERWSLARTQEDLWLTVFNFLNNRHRLISLGIWLVHWNYKYIHPEEEDSLDEQRDDLLKAIHRLRGIKNVQIREEVRERERRYTTDPDLHRTELVMMQKPGPVRMHQPMPLNRLIGEIRRSRLMQEDRRRNEILFNAQRAHYAHARQRNVQTERSYNRAGLRTTHSNSGYAPPYVDKYARLRRGG